MGRLVVIEGRKKTRIVREQIRGRINEELLRLLFVTFETPMTRLGMVSGLKILRSNF